MKFGRIKIWFALRKITPFLDRGRFFRGIFGQEVVRWLINPDPKNDLERMRPGCVMSSRTVRAAKDYAKKEGKTLSDYGFTTYWIWRFYLVIHTPEYHLKNPW